MRRQPCDPSHALTRHSDPPPYAANARPQGTGQILLQGDGTLQGWTIQNVFKNGGSSGTAPTPPLNMMPNNVFALSATPVGGKQQAFVLATPAPYTEANCRKDTAEPAHVTPEQVKRLQDLPGIKGLSVTAKYPVAEVDYEIPGCPVTVAMECMTPLIPNDAKSSSFPAAVFTFTVTNPSKDTAVAVDLMQTTQNLVGWDGATDCVKGPTPFWGGNVNTPFADAGGPAGLLMTSDAVGASAFNAGSIAISACPGTNSVAGVISGAATEQELFAAFTAGKMVPASKAAATAASAKGSSWCGAATQSVTVAPGATETVSFVLSWYFPNRPSYSKRANLPDVLGNNYANWFADAADVAKSLVADAPRLLSMTRAYRDALYGSTMPWQFVETAGGRAACARSPTMWWTKAGVVLGNEGNQCCPLNCSHVYGYTTMLERLWPELAKDMRVTDFVRCYNKGVTMRYGSGFAIDGALAGVLKTYLVVQQADSGATWLPTVWPNVKAQMESILANFDAQGDGMFRCPQQNTYDTAMNGPNTFIGSYYVAALKATAAMAALMGDAAFQKTCADRAVLSSTNYEKTCWNEKFGYYVADVNINNCSHSYGPGCFIDQLCAVGLSSACGLGCNFDPAHEARARKAILEYNTVGGATPFHDMQGHFYPGDVGIRACTYPNGKLAKGMQYDTIVSIGFTYPVVAGMLLDRNVKDATTIAGYIRARHDGRHRSPWDEPECGLLYSRAMAGWNLFDQCAGFAYDSTKGHLGFDPRTNATDFKCFVTIQDGWGTFSQAGPAGLPTGTVTLTATCGSMGLATLGVVSSAKAAAADIDGHSITAAVAGGVITFAPKLKLRQGSILTVKLSGGVAEPPAYTAEPCCQGSNCSPSSDGLRKRGGAAALPEKSLLSVELESAAVPNALDATTKLLLFLRYLMIAFLLFASGLIAGHFITLRLD